MACPMGAETRPHRGRGVGDRTDYELSPCLVCSCYEPPLGKHSVSKTQLKGQSPPPVSS